MCSNGAAANVSFQRVTACRPAGRHNQKSFELVSPKFFSSGITKVAVLKFAIGKPELDLVGSTVFLSDNEMRSNSIHRGDVNSSRYSGD